MAERKVLNKYFPPDFDPALIPRRKGVKSKQQVVRLMAPFSMRCNTCGEYIYKGKKFNARKETVDGEDYYGIKIFRFYIKCTLCSAEITFKTDPKNTDYAAEHGASRNFEPWREEGEKEEVDKLARMEEEENNPMKALENRTVDSKREMDILDALQDIRARNARNERLTHKEGAEEVDLVARIRAGEVETEEERRRREEEEEDELVVRQVFTKVAMPGSSAGPGPSTVAAAAARASSSSSTASTPPGSPPPADAPALRQMTVKRKADGDEPDLHALLPDTAKQLISSKVLEMHAAKKKKMDAKKSLGIKIGKTKVIKA